MANQNDGEHTVNGLAEAQVQDLEARIALTRALQEMLEFARPRLLRLVRLQGVPANMAEDVVQESLLAAWKSLKHLHDPDRFDAWLDSICRNISRQHIHVAQGQTQRQIPLGMLTRTKNEADDEEKMIDYLDAQLFDPSEELEKQDLPFAFVSSTLPAQHN
ncbi:MAG: sigma factor [Ktedonobacteraceae bacterium]